LPSSSKNKMLLLGESFSSQILTSKSKPKNHCGKDISR
jgi:hypothetical protein